MPEPCTCCCVGVDVTTLYFHHCQQSSTPVTLAATSVERLPETLHSMLYHDARASFTFSCTAQSHYFFKNIATMFVALRLIRTCHTICINYNPHTHEYITDQVNLFIHCSDTAIFAKLCILLSFHFLLSKWTTQCNSLENN